VPKHHAMTTYGRMEVQLHTFLTKALDGGEQLASHPSCSTPGRRALGPTEQEAGWGPEPVWTRWWREKISVPSDNQTLVIQTVA